MTYIYNDRGQEWLLHELEQHLKQEYDLKSMQISNEDGRKIPYQKVKILKGPLNNEHNSDDHSFDFDYTDNVYLRTKPKKSKILKQGFVFVFVFVCWIKAN